MAEEAQAAQGSKKMSLKTFLILAAVLLIEALGFTAAYLLWGGPAKVGAATTAEDAEAIKNQLVEELVVTGKFQNIKSNRSYLYDTEVYIKVRQKDQKTIKEELESKRAAITMAIATIIRSAEPVHLDEPKLATVTRQIKAALEGLLSGDAETGKSRVAHVSIPKFIRYRSDL